MEQRPRTWLIGEHNPYVADPRHALYPWPPQCSGYRLCYDILGMKEAEYLARFERRNLLTAAKWSAPAAREAATKLLAETRDHDRLVLLGAKVAKAFGFAYVPLSQYVYSPDTASESEIVFFGKRTIRALLILPHPSGLNRAWADPTLAPRVRAAVEALLET